MRFSVKAHHLPQRVATGAFILNSGIGKLRADEEAATQLHGFATGAYPFLARLKPADFVRLLAVSEITLGAALLLPVVPAAVAAGLTASGASAGGSSSLLDMTGPPSAPPPPRPRRPHRRVRRAAQAPRRSHRGARSRSPRPCWAPTVGHRASSAAW